MSDPDPRAQEDGIERVRLVIVRALSVVGKSADEIEKIAKAIAIRYELKIEAPTRDGVIEQLVEILKAEGYFVSKRVKWEKIGDFRKRLGLAHEALHKILRSPICPPVELHRGSARKQILAINSNPVFEDFCLTVKGKTPEKAQ